jgi:hypothetical protein
MTSEWDQRQLCSDGGCTGVIGADGTCKVCGRVAPNWGDERRRGRRNTDEVDAEAEAAAPPPAQSVVAPAPVVGTLEIDDDLDKRQLCPDGSCIGVIGDDGRCRVCGRAA